MASSAHLLTAEAMLDSPDSPVDVQAVLRAMASAGSVLAQRMLNGKCGDCGQDLYPWETYGSCYCCREDRA